MATRKNNFLNAKPVSRMGGGSGGVRKPSKPYASPASTSGKPKLKAKPQKPDARDVMPNSRAKKINLPSAANNAVPPKQGPTLKGTTPKTRISPNAARDSMPNSRARGINLPKAANNAIPPKPGPSLRGVTPGLRSSASTAASLGSRFASGLGAVATAGAMVDKAREVFNPKDNILTRGAALGRSIERVVGGGGGGNATPAQRAAKLKAQQNAKPSKPPLSSTGVRTNSGNTVRTGSPEYNRYRQQQLDDNKRRNASVRDTTPSRQSTPSSGGGNSSPSRSSGGGNNAPRTSASRSQTPSAPRFTGSVDEGRQKWAEKYSSSKYDGQAIQKEAKKLIDEMKKRKEDKSNSSKAGWDGNKNY